MTTNMDQTQSIILIGFMGCGKTSIAKQISKKANLRYIDTDNEIVSTAQMSIPHIFEKYGESYFRQIEAAVAERTGRQPGCVVATGGGIIKNPDNIVNLKKSGILIYLKASAEKLYANISGDQGQLRPLLDTPDKMDRIRSLLAERDPLYLQYSDFVLDTSALSVADAADAIIEKHLTHIKRKQ